MERVECRQLFGETVLLLGQVRPAGYNPCGRTPRQAWAGMAREERNAIRGQRQTSERPWAS